MASDEVLFPPVVMNTTQHIKVCLRGAQMRHASGVTAGPGNTEGFH